MQTTLLKDVCMSLLAIVLGVALFLAGIGAAHFMLWLGGVSARLVFVTGLFFLASPLLVLAGSVGLIGSFLSRRRYLSSLAAILFVGGVWYGIYLLYRLLLTLGVLH